MTPTFPQAFATRAVHGGAEADPSTGARAMPIFQTNGFVFEDQEHGADVFAMRRQGFSYSRGSNPTVAALERRIASLEGGTAGVALASGQSAWLVALLTLCATGDEYVGSSQVFGGSLGLMKRLDKRLNVKCVLAEPTPERIAAAITPRARAIVVEAIVNPTGEVVDLDGIAEVAKAHHLPLVVDSTLASPALLRPIEHGADIVIHSASKFMVGNGTAIGGLIVDAGTFTWEKDTRYPLIAGAWEDYENIVPAERFPKNAFATACRLLGLRELGPGMQATTAFFILTGIETLPLRMRRHCENAEAVANFLSTHEAVASVSYPGVPNHPNHNLARRYCPDGLGSIFMITLKSAEKAKQVLTRVNLFSHLVNLGETRSLIAHPASTTHRSLSPRERASFGITDATLRLSIGIEDAPDLIADLAQALD
ncbi:MAG: O-acetylhomoserine aminocarboxypropyltransferase/cysteine synthase [Hyphomicrobiales bacterium]|nr:O-acetylhomoserine aminocarboxypropyltransferase/cysteine synthase [Hyphomicrobiales bacterium]